MMKKTVDGTEKPAVVIFSLRDIQAHEELTYNYGPGGSKKYYWRTTKVSVDF